MATELISLPLTEREQIIVNAALGVLGKDDSGRILLLRHLESALYTHDVLAAQQPT